MNKSLMQLQVDCFCVLCKEDQLLQKLIRSVMTDKASCKSVFSQICHFNDPILPSDWLESTA